MPAGPEFSFPGEYRKWLTRNAKTIHDLMVKNYGGISDMARGDPEKVPYIPGEYMWGVENTRRYIHAIGTNSADEETETKKALDRVLDDLPKGRIAPKDCDRLADAANKSKTEQRAFGNILGRKP